MQNEARVGFGPRRIFASCYLIISYLRRRSESDGVFTGCQPQYPDLQGNFNLDSEWVQAVFAIARHLPSLNRDAHPAYSVIEEFVEGFIEGFLIKFHEHFVQFNVSQCSLSRTPHGNGMDLDGSSNMKTMNVTRTSTFCLIRPLS
jgi:hypothetical protein